MAVLSGPLVTAAREGPGCSGESEASCRHVCTVRDPSASFDLSSISVVHISHLFPNAPFHFTFLVLLFKMSLAPWQFKHFPCTLLKSFMFYFFSYLFPISSSLGSQDPTVSRSSCFLATQFEADCWVSPHPPSTFTSFWISPSSLEKLFYQLCESLRHASPTDPHPHTLTVIAGYSKRPLVAALDQ